MFLFRKCMLKSREKQLWCSADKDPYSQGSVLPSGHVQLWELVCKGSRAPKNLCLWIVVLEKTPENLLDSNKIKPINFKGNQPWTLIGRTDAEAEALIFWSTDANSRLIGKVPDAGKAWWQKERRAWEDERAVSSHGCNGHELGQTSGKGEEQGGLACCSPWGPKELDMIGWLNNSKLKSLWGEKLVISMSEMVCKHVWQTGQKQSDWT